MPEFSSGGFEKPLWKSPRKVEEEIRDYQRKRFEDYMELADIGMLTRALAISALREELEYTLMAVDDCPTEAIDSEALKRMLEDGEDTLF